MFLYPSSIWSLSWHSDGDNCVPYPNWADQKKVSQNFEYFTNPRLAVTNAVTDLLWFCHIRHRYLGSLLGRTDLTSISSWTYLLVVSRWIQHAIDHITHYCCSVLRSSETIKKLIAPKTVKCGPSYQRNS